MIYVVIAAVLGFAGWQLYKFVRRMNVGCCSTSDCASCDCSLKKYKVQDRAAKDGGHQTLSQAP
ncbi:hypothetical protein JQC72_06520 [Polycladomyces sp. WAk]|uniref:FeoB-associated Cys-rich membrane protein n=1 Tax=Polycladomyces zharkentensis TaxID=2807616 RepID=A0ABS2WHZ2_9BACL|nr:hypothetical protein [Polycladomyces sp. WAk]MBN2909175.1 hypothetical protein [Polycladomyces sp. WAk]